MPTLLDSFIFELKLDPTDFNESQRRAADALERVENRAVRSGQRMEQSGQGVAVFFRNIEAPLAGLRRQFEQLATQPRRPQAALADLATQGRRTGADVRAGALDGASGLRVLGAAGLTAFATVSALDKLMKAAGESARTVFGANVGAGAAGVPIQEFSAISQALLHKGNVPEAETQNWLAQYRQAQEQAKIGHPEQAIALNTAFAQMGVNASAFDTSPEEALLRIAQRFHEVSTAEASAYGGLIGQSAALAQALHNLGNIELQRQIAAERARSITATNSEEARKLIESQNNLAISWGKLTRLIYDDLDPAFSSFYNWLTKIIGSIITLNDPNATRGDFLEGQRGEAWGNIPGTTNWWLKWWKNRPKLFGGTGSDGGGAPSGSSGNSPANFSNNGGTAAEREIIQRESGGNPYIGFGGADLRNAPRDATGFPQWSGNMGPAGISHAAGIYQIQPALWRKYAPTVGVTDFTPESQKKVYDAIVKAEGYRPWAASGRTNFVPPSAPTSTASSTSAPSAFGLGSLEEAFTLGKMPPQARTAESRQTQLQLSSAYADALGKGFKGTIQDFAASRSGSAAPIPPIPSTQPIQQNQATPGPQTHNYGDTHIGDVTVHTQASDGPGVVHAFNEAARRNMLVSQANSGLS